MRRYWCVRFAFLVAAALPLAGCALQYSTGTLGVPVTMAEPLSQPVPGDSFTVTAKAVHLLWGLVATKQPSLQHALAGQLGSGAAVHNLAIRSRKTWSDVLLTGLTLGLISPTSVTFQGVIAPARP